MKTTVFFDNGASTTFHSRRDATNIPALVAEIRGILNVPIERRTGNLVLENRRTAVVVDVAHIVGVRLG